MTLRHPSRVIGVGGGGGQGAGGPVPSHFLGKNFKKEDYHLTIKNTELIYK